MKSSQVLEKRGISLRLRSLHMLASLRTAAVFGIEACPVQVEVDVSFGFPRFAMVGLPDASVGVTELYQAHAVGLVPVGRRQPAVPGRLVARGTGTMVGRTPPIGLEETHGYRRAAASR